MTDVPDWAGDAYKALAESLDKGVVELTAEEKQQALLNAMLDRGQMYDDIKFWVEGARKSIEIEKKALAAFVATFGERDRATPQTIAENIADGLYKDGLSIRAYAGGTFGHWPADDEHAVRLIAKIIEQSVDSIAREMNQCPT